MHAGRRGGGRYGRDMYPPLDILSGPGSSWAAIPGPAAAGLGGPPAAVVGLAVALVLAGCALRRLARVRRALGIGQDADPRAGSAPAAPEHADPGTESPPRREPSPWPEATARLEPATLDALGDVIGEARRRRVAGERIQRELVPVLEAGWLVERDIAIGGGGRIPWLVMGASGVFALEACDGCWTLERLAALAVRVDALGAALAGYDGPLVGAVVLAFDESAPRRWYGGASSPAAVPGSSGSTGCCRGCSPSDPTAESRVPTCAAWAPPQTLR